MQATCRVLGPVGKSDLVHSPLVDELLTDASSVSPRLSFWPLSLSHSLSLSLSLSHTHSLCVYVCVFIKLHITAQSGLVILVILCHSR